MNNIEIKTARLTLASLTPDHAAGPYLSWMQDAEILRFLEARFSEQNEASIRAFIEKCNDDDGVMMLGIFLDQGGTHIGNIKLGPINQQHAHANVGFLIGDKAEWGKGYATEAIAAVTRYGLETLGLHKIGAGIYETNEGSKRALLKAGFREEGYRPEHYFCDGEWIGEVLVGRVAGQSKDGN